ncbi:MAG: cobyrinate a,c-diamide synthase [Oscillospiraceae bacterium]
MERRIPRLLLAGTNSGCGKTTVACAVLQALVNRKLRVGAFKCGPDYIDPMFHSRIIGAKSANLDLFFFDENTMRGLLARSAADCDVSVIEGVMGYYDGMGLTSTRASSYEVARASNSPVVLVVNARGSSLSILATIHGFLTFCPDSGIRGVILNQCTAMTYEALARAIRERFDGRVEPLGYLPPMPDCALESRHLGLVTAAEVAGLKEKMAALAEQAEKTIDLDGLLKLAEGAEPVCYEPVELPHYDTPVRIAVARDKAFCFYYEDSLQALRDMGAELVEFSPLADERLPENIQGLYLGGGYPELYAERLSENRSIRDSIRTALERGLPCIAECGGFMYLTQAIAGHPMVGFLPGECFDTGKLRRFGYVTLKAKTDNLLCKAGDEIRGHEFHHWDATVPGDSFTAFKSTGKSWDCVVATDRLYAGYPHFHFYANPAFAKGFYETCLKELGEYV